MHNQALEPYEQPLFLFQIAPGSTQNNGKTLPPSKSEYKLLLTKGDSATESGPCTDEQRQRHYRGRRRIASFEEMLLETYNLKIYAPLCYFTLTDTVLLMWNVSALLSSAQRIC